MSAQNDPLGALLDSLPPAAKTQPRDALSDLLDTLPAAADKPITPAIPPGVQSGPIVNGQHVAEPIQPAIPLSARTGPIANGAPAPAITPPIPPDAHTGPVGQNVLPFMEAPGIPRAPLPEGLKSDQQIGSEATERIDPRTGLRYKQIPSAEFPLNWVNSIGTHGTEGVEALARPTEAALREAGRNAVTETGQPPAGETNIYPGIAKDVARGGSKLIQAGAEAALPLAGVGALAAPVETAATIGAGMLAQKGVEGGLKSAGVAPEYSEFAGDLAGIAAGATIAGWSKLFDKIDVHNAEADRLLKEEQAAGQASVQTSNISNVVVPPEGIPVNIDGVPHAIKPLDVNFDPLSAPSSRRPIYGVYDEQGNLVNSGTGSQVSQFLGKAGAVPADAPPPTHADLDARYSEMTVERSEAQADVDRRNLIQNLSPEGLAAERARLQAIVDEQNQNIYGRKLEGGGYQFAQEEVTSPERVELKLIDDHLATGKPIPSDLPAEEVLKDATEKLGDIQKQRAKVGAENAKAAEKAAEVSVPPPAPEPESPELEPEPEPAPPVKPTRVKKVSAATPNPPTAALPTTPESPDTIAVQLGQLGAFGAQPTPDQRKAVMFPGGQGMPTVFPEGTRIHNDGMGNIYVYRPDLIEPGEITRAARNNKLGEVLGGPMGMGAPDKTELKGEPLAVVARGPDGTEVQTTATDAENLPVTHAATQMVTPPGGSVSVEPAEKVIAEREGQEGSSSPPIDESVYQQAVDLVKNSDRASTAILQRNLRLGYGAAARILDRMEREGIVGRQELSGQRQVLAQNPTPVRDSSWENSAQPDWWKTAFGTENIQEPWETVRDAYVNRVKTDPGFGQTMMDYAGDWADGKAEAGFDRRALQPPVRPVTPQLPTGVAGATPLGVQSREPWEMRRDEYVGSGETPGSSTSRLNARELTNLSKGLGITGYDTKTVSGRNQLARAIAHKSMVKRAIERGEQVPPAVLADYPDIAPAKSPLDDLLDSLPAPGITPEGLPEEGERRVTGSADIPLTEGGEEQIEDMAKKAVKPFDFIIHGPSKRATETATILAHTSPNPSVSLDSLGAWKRAASEGMPADEVKAEMAHLIMNPDVIPPGVSPISGEPGESWNTMAHRMFTEVRDIAADWQEGERVLLITSGGNLQAVDAWGKAKYPVDFEFDHTEMAAKPYMSVTGKIFRLSDSGLEQVQNNEQPGIYFIEHGETAWNSKEGGATAQPETEVTSNREPESATTGTTEPEPTTTAGGEPTAGERTGQVNPEPLAEVSPEPRPAPAAVGEPGGGTGGSGSTTRGDLRTDEEGGTRSGPGERISPGTVDQSGETNGGRSPGDLTKQTEGGDFRIAPSDHIGEGTPRQKLSDNLEAIRIVKELDGKPATPEQQEKLAKYVGWGGLWQIFDWNKRDWAGAREELRGLLTPDEYKAAEASTKNAHYTSPEVIASMWSAMQRFGVTPGFSVIEPSMGVGTFFGMQPDGLMPARRTGIELDKITGQIAKALYPDSNVQITGFEKISLPADFFDVAIGNVPFGNYPVYDPAYKRNKTVTRSIHNYFFVKSLDLTRPGGIVGFITSRYTMDAEDPTLRQLLASKADLVGMIRLPNTAFKGNAGTEVVTDVIFLQKRAHGQTAAGQPFTETREVQTPSGPTLVNQYFAEHPDMVLGDLAVEGGMYRGNEQTVNGKITPEILQAAVERMPSDIYKAWKPDTPAADDVSYFELGDEVKDGGYAIKDGVIVQREGNIYRPTAITGLPAQRIRGMVPVKGALRNVFSTQLADAPEAEITAAREALNRAYDSFVKEYGPLNSAANSRALGDDPDYLPLAGALEDYDREEKTAKKTDIFTKRTIERPKFPDKAGNAAEALAMVLNERGRLDWNRMQELSGKTPDELRAELAGQVFQNPDGRKWETQDEYLSGNVRQKLEMAEKAAAIDPAFGRNVDALKEVQPRDLTPEEIKITPGAPWIPAETVQQFVREILDLHSAEVHYANSVAAWSITVPKFQRDRVANEKTFGVESFYGHELFDVALNGKAPKVYTDGPNDTRVLDSKATAVAQAAQDALKDKFREWIWDDADRADELSAKYNREMNNLRVVDHDGSFLTLPGSNPAITLRPHQKNVTWRALKTGNTLLAHEVGAGKAQPLDAKLLTPSGWIRMGEIVVGDQVIAGDGMPTVVEAVFPQGDKEIFRVEFSDGSSTECCDEHLWLTRTYKERTSAINERRLSRDWPSCKPKVRSLGEIRESLVAPRLGAKNHSIPMVEQVQFSAKSVPLDPYLIGVLLGDGCLRGNGTISISSADQELINYVSAALPEECEIRHRSAYDYDICRRVSFSMAVVNGYRSNFNPVIAAVSQLGMAGKYAHEKNVPPEYLINSAPVRIAVLQGLLDTDGSVNKAGTSVTYCSSSEGLADDVTFIVESLGGTVTRREKDPAFTYRGVRKIGRKAYELHLRLPAEVSPFRLGRKDALVRPKSKYKPVRYITNVIAIGCKQSQCIRVAHPSHLYVTDRFIVTHNTWEMAAIAMESRRLGLAKKPIIAVPNHMAEQFTSEFLQLYPAARILTIGKEDFAANNRKRAVSRIAGGNWDTIIIRHSSFEKIPVSDATYQAFVDDQVAELRAALEEQVAEVGKDAKKDKTVKEIQKAISRLETKLENHLNREDKDDAVTFEQLGVDMLLVDEAHCFPAEALVTTDVGLLPIGEIVTKRLPVKVLSCDTETGELSWREITRWHDNYVSNPVVRVTHENGYFDCTSNHQIWTEESGYVQAGSLERETLRIVWRQGISIGAGCTRQESEDLQSSVLGSMAGIHAGTSVEKLRMVQQTVPVQIKREDQQRQTSILQPNMFGLLAEFESREYREIQGLDSPIVGMYEGPEISKAFGADAVQQPYARPGHARKDAPITCRSYIPCPGREGNANGAADYSIESAEFTNRVPDKDASGMGEVSVPAELLHGRLGGSIDNAGNRGGRQNAQPEEVEISGLPKDRGPQCSRVVSVALHESGSPYGPEFSDSKDSRVYCLEVEGNHNFFADGVLVSNSFKALPIITRRTRVVGIPTRESNRATDMYMKTQYISGLHGGGKGVVFATGTPVTNTMAELYNMQRYLQPKALRDAGIQHFDAWANMFGDVRRGVELDVSGKGFRENTRFAKFINIPELMTMYRQTADVKTAEMMKLPRPDLETGGPIPITAPESPELTAYVDYLIDRSEAVRSGSVDKREDNMLKIVSEGKKAALDMRLVDPIATDRPTSKVNKAVQNIHKIWKETEGSRATQVVFCDLSTPKSAKAKKKPAPAEEADGDDQSAVPEAAGEAAGFSVYDDMRRKLINSGIPAKEIAFIHDYSSDDDKQDLFDAVNAGRVRVLFGSTEKMGVGTNVQRRMIALHHMDSPWRPADIKQRDGRIQRQGNMHPRVQIYQYITEGSFDAYSWQLLENKAAFIGPILSGDSTVREMEDIGMILPSAAEFKAMASGNPMIKEKIGTDAELGRLDAQRNGYRRQMSGVRQELATLPDKIAAHKENIAKAQIDLKTIEDHKDDGYKIGERNFTGDDARKEAAAALHAALDSWKQDVVPQLVGSYRGLEIWTRNPYAGIRDGNFPDITLRGKMSYQANSNADNPAGTLSSIEATVRNQVGPPKWMLAELPELEAKEKQLKGMADRPWKDEKRYQDLVKRKIEIDAALDESEAEKAAGADEGEGVTEQKIAKGTSYQERKRILLSRDLGAGVDYPSAAEEAAPAESEGVEQKPAPAGVVAPKADFGPIALYRPGRQKPAANSDLGWLHQTAGNRKYYSNGHFAIEGKAPGKMAPQETPITTVFKSTVDEKPVQALAFSKEKDTRVVWFGPNVAVDARYYDAALKAFPKATFALGKLGSPAIFVNHDGRTVGVIMTFKADAPKEINYILHPGESGALHISGSLVDAAKDVGAFFKEDVAPAAKAVAAKAQSMRQALQHAFAPQTIDSGAKLTQGGLRAMFGRQMLATDRAKAAFNGFKSEFYKRPTDLGVHAMNVIDAIEDPTGVALSSLPTLDANYVRAVRAEYDSRWKRLNDLGRLSNYLQNYYTHLYKDPKKAGDFVASWQARRPISGAERFRKQRKYPTFREAITPKDQGGGGLEPMFDNPVDYLYAGLAQMDKAITAHEFFDEIKPNLKFSRGAPPDGYEQVNDKIFTVNGPRFGAVRVPGSANIEPGDVEVFGQRVMGHWYAPAGMAAVINNHLGPSIRDTRARSLFDTWNAVKGAMNAINLGFSAFHATTTTYNSAISELSLALKQAAAGSPAKAMNTAGKSVAFPLVFVRDQLRGKRLVAAWDGTLKNATPEEMEIVQALKQAGGSPHQSSFNERMFRDGLRRAWAQKKYTKAAVRVVNPLLWAELTTAPIAAKLVPRAKMAAFMNAVRQEIEQHPAMGQNEQRDRFGHIWDSMDNRFGQLNQRNMLMNKMVNDTMNALVGRPGWTLGTLREMLGGTYDLGKAAIDGGRGKPPELSWRTSGALAILIYGAFLSGLMTAIMTHTMPHGVDYIDPRTGGITEDGQPARILMPGYLSRDIHSWLTAPGDTIKGKLAQPLMVVADLTQNRDHYHHKIYGQDGIGLRQYLTNLFLPYSATGIMRNRDRGDSIGKMLLPMAGIQPASKSVGSSRAQQMVTQWHEDQNSEVRPPTSIRSRAEAQVFILAKKGDFRGAQQKGEEAVANGQMSHKQVRDMITRARTNPLLADYKGVSDVRASMRIYDVATPEEKILLQREANDKARRAQAKPWAWNNPDGTPDKQARAIALKYFKVTPYTRAR